nr:MAG TPA_asm: hypothetical protein [Caudoviricetes sp.]
MMLASAAGAELIQTISSTRSMIRSTSGSRVTDIRGYVRQCDI